MPTSARTKEHYAPPFHTVSGSGAEGETIQSLGCVLPKTYMPTEKEVQKPSVSGALLVTFPAWEK